VSGNLGDGLRVEINRNDVPTSESYVGTVIRGNQFEKNRDDGLRLEGPSATVSLNRADDNGKLGIESPLGVTDGGGNAASGNGDPRQCVGVVCRP
jgi:hypothetical protein